jgi:formylglycine-generating enzyme required for sulfatase activity
MSSFGTICGAVSGYVNVGGVDFVQLTGGRAKIGDAEFSDNPIRQVDIQPGLLFARDPITNDQMDEYIREMGDQTHALVIEDKETRQFRIVERGPEKCALAFAFGNPVLKVGANMLFGQYKYVRVVPAADRLKKLSAQEFAASDHPAVCVSWFDGVGFLDYKSHKTGRVWRFPSSGEWQAAALSGRDPEIIKFGTASGEESKLANEAQFKAGMITSSVGRFPANPWGIRGMAGNVEQWTEERGSWSTREHTWRITHGGSCYSINYLGLQTGKISQGLVTYLEYNYVGLRGAIEKL